MEGKDGRTEKATGKKRGEARQKGQLAFSQEIVSVVVLMLGLFALRVYASGMLSQIGELMREITRFPAAGDVWSPKLVQTGAVAYAMLVGKMLMPLCGVALLGGIVGSVGQTGPFFETKPLAWKLSGLNPIQGFKKLFSFQSVVNLILSIFKVALVSTVLYLLVRKRIMEFTSLTYCPTGLFLEWIMMLLYRVAMWVMVLFIVIAVADMIYKKYKHEKDLMMTKEEVKEEHKQQETSPVVKRAQRKKMREMSLLRMMAAVPEATVIITNPTHVAVALQYNPAEMDAPKVTAKGLRLVAQRIKRIAAEHNIPVLERPELARALYKEVEVGRQIPSRFFEAVAEILAYLHKLGKRVVNMQKD